jgi:ParB family chromosome partitioning protein
MTQEQVAKRVGKSRSAVANHLRLFQLSPAVQKLVGEGLLSAGHAKAILGHPDRAYQETVAKRVVSESLSVREVEQLIKERIDLEAGLGGAAATGGGASESGEPTPDPERKLRPPGILELEELLASYLDTRVGVSMTAKRGKVTVEFANLEDLERLYRRIIE